MMSKLLVLLGMVVVVFGLVSCCCIFKSKPTKLQLKNSGSTVKTSMNKTIQVVLDANATTGYTWQIAGYDKKILKLNKSAYKVNSKLVGAGGEQFYCFDVVGKGKTQLKIIYHRPWEKDIKPAKTFSVNIAAE